MAIWAIADLHLAISTPEKNMDVFGDEWIGYMDKIAENWKEIVKPEDLMLIAGDISWAMQIEKAKIDLEWIDALPGTKVMIRGNHDYWWSSIGKVKKILTPTLHVIQNDAFQWGDISIAGTRLWDSPEFHYYETSLTQEDEKIFERELQRLELSLKELRQDAAVRIAMTHYPPLGPEMKPTKVTALLEKYNVNNCVFGHLHHAKKEKLQWGELNGIRYFLTACDYLDFKPLRIL